MSRITEQLRELEIQVMTAAGSGQADAVAPLLADDFFEIGASGRTYTKAEVLTAIREAPRREFTIADLRVLELAPESALVTYRATARSAAGTSSSYRSTLWQRRGGEWKIVFHQGTEIAS